MSRKGGYLIVDLSVDLNKEENTRKIYNQLVNSKHKVVLVSGYKDYEDTWCTLSTDKNGYPILRCNDFSISIGEDEYTTSSGYTLKLVATGTYDEEKTTENSEAFNLDNILEPNKIYLLEYYNNDYGDKSVTYFKTKPENENIKTDFKGTFTLPTEDYEIVLGGMEYLYMFNGETETFDNYIKVFSYNNIIASGSEDYVKVYELPFTI